MFGRLILHRGITTRPDMCALKLRVDDISGADYYNIAYLTIAQGHGVAAGTSCIDWLSTPPAITGPIQDLQLEAHLRADPGLNKANWRLEVVGQDLREFLHFIGDDKLDLLVSHGALANTPDQAAKRIAILQLRAADLRAQADEIENQIRAERPDCGIEP